MTSAPSDDVVAGLDYVERNRLAWERWAPHYLGAGRRAWAERQPRWGMWGVVESEVRLLDGCVQGMDAVDLGCGTGYVCAWLAQAGLRPVGVDIAQSQLENATLLQREFNLPFPLVRANAEAVPYDDGSFDVAISEYGASVWCDPYRWVPEAARLLRPGGTLVFVVTSPFLITCTPSSGGAARERLQRPYFGRQRVEFESDNAVEFHLGTGDWLRVLRANGFEVEDLIEVRPPANAAPRYDFVSTDWARNWPSEEVWKARRA